jgi:hypothetical protein
VKSGILTATVAYTPSELFSALSHAQANGEPVNDEAFGARLNLAGTLIMAQIKIANQAQGTMIDLTVKKYFIFCGETNMNGNCSSQNKK